MATIPKVQLCILLLPNPWMAVFYTLHRLKLRPSLRTSIISAAFLQRTFSYCLCHINTDVEAWKPFKAMLDVGFFDSIQVSLLFCEWNKIFHDLLIIILLNLFSSIFKFQFKKSGLNPQATFAERVREVKNFLLRTFLELIRGQSYQTFYNRNLRILAIS